jgi:S1-C subfamily serine protease
MSGGPLLDENGCVVGTHGRRGQNPNRYQGVPINQAIGVLEEKIRLDTGESDSFRQGILVARQARRLFRSAREANQSPDWRKIAEHLRRAIGFMEAVPNNHPRYQDAQKRIDQYRQWLDKIENSRSNEQYHL